MADNVTLNSGTGGAVAAADDIGSVFYQRVKPNLGADGTAVDAIPVSNGLDTTATGVQAVGLVGHFDDTATGTVTENQFAPVRISTRRALLVEGVASGTVIPVSDGGGALTVDGTVAVSGTVTVDGSGVTQPVSHAALTELAAAIDTELQVDVVGALPAGTNNIGDVDILSIVPGTGATNLGKAIDTATGGTDTGVLALATRDDALGALTPVEGDNVQLRTDANGALWTHDDALDAALAGTELQVDVVASLPAGTNNIGDVDVLSVVTGTAATNLGKAEDAAHTTGDVGVYALAVRDDAPAAHSGTDGDYESLHVSAEGSLWVSPTPSASGGLTIFRSLDLDESEEEVKATAGTVYGAWVTNTATTTRWLKFYNLTAANTTVGTSTPVITIGIPGNSSDDISGHFAAGGHGIGFSTAISVAATTGVADADTGAPAANDVIVNIFYK